MRFGEWFITDEVAYESRRGFHGSIQPQQHSDESGAWNRKINIQKKIKNPWNWFNCIHEFLSLYCIEFWQKTNFEYLPDPSQSLKLYCCSKMLLGRPSGWQQETTCVSHEFHPINFWRGLSPKGHLVYHAQQRSIQIWQTKKLRTTESTQWWYADAEMKNKNLWSSGKW